MFCVEKGTEEVQAWATGFKPITTQNIVRKLTEAITRKGLEDPSVQLLIHVDEKIHTGSKTYQKFIQGYSDSFLEFQETEYQRCMQNFLSLSFKYELGNKTLSQALAHHLKNRVLIYFSNIISNFNAILAKVNQTIHGSTDAAIKTTEHVKSATSGVMTAKDVMILYVLLSLMLEHVLM